MNLTPEQSAAVNAGPMVCLTACAGSGKTTVLVERIAKLIADGSEPEKVVAITFTRRAAAELKRRLALKGITIGYAGTVHSFCLGLINRHLDRKLSACPQQLLIARIEKEISESCCKASRPTAETVLKQQDDSKYPWSLAILNRVRTLLQNDGLIDFDGILKWMTNEKYVVEKLDQLRDHHLLIDEFQDTGPLERQFYELLRPSTMMIVGDWRQTLYGFRGADPESMQRMAALKGMEMLSLTKNFRCSVGIQITADTGLENKPSLVWSSHSMSIKEVAECVQYGIDSKLFDPFNTVLCGQNETVRLLSEELKVAGIKVITAGRPSRESIEMEAYIRYAQDRENPAILEHLLGLIDPTYLTYCKSEATKKLCEITDFGHQQNAAMNSMRTRLIDVINANPDATLDELASGLTEPPEQQDGLLVTTIHSAKGLEWDSVAVVDDMGDTEHHRRMRYVAATRARHHLKIYRHEPSFIR